MFCANVCVRLDLINESELIMEQTSISTNNKMVKLSVIVPCYNEERTLARCIEKVLNIKDDSLSLEIIIVDDGSTDNSLDIARDLEVQHNELIVLEHQKNQGKGAALRTGFRRATGDFVCVQDADLEYNPMELRSLLIPLINDDADVVLGSRFLTSGAHRVLYFWHYIGNRLLTLLSNMFTDLNLTDMETCYKVFKREVIQSIEIKENRFGFEPEIVAKIAHKRLRIYEIGISYFGRTYEEGKKIGFKDGLRALYCILRYNAYKAPVPIQFIFYSFIGAVAALVNFLIFMCLFKIGLHVVYGSAIAFVIAAAVNYILCILILFRHKARWNTASEVIIYIFVITGVGFLDVGLTNFLFQGGMSAEASKLSATAMGLCLNFLGRRYFVFPEAASGKWQPQVK